MEIGNYRTILKLNTPVNIGSVVTIVTTNVMQIGTYSSISGLNTPVNICSVVRIATTNVIEILTYSVISRLNILWNNEYIIYFDQLFGLGRQM